MVELLVFVTVPDERPCHVGVRDEYGNLVRLTSVPIRVCDAWQMVRKVQVEAVDTQPPLWSGESDDGHS